MIFTIAGKELKALFASPLAWVVLTGMQIIVGYGFLKRLDDFLQIQAQLSQMPSPPGVTELVAAPTFATLAAILLFAVPLLAMRLIAEERRNQTMVLLMSAPLSMTEIVLGKFLGLIVFLLLIIGLTALMPLLARRQHASRFRHAAEPGDAALALLAAGFAAVSLYASCLTAQPMVAALGRLRPAARHAADGRNRRRQPARARLDGARGTRAGALAAARISSRWARA